MPNLKIAKISLRLGLALVFGYAAIGSFLQPDIWIGYLPIFISRLAFAETFLKVFSAVELLLAVWLLSGWKSKYSAILAALMLAGIVAANFSDLSIFFRDFGLIFAAIGLAFLS